MPLAIMPPDGFYHLKELLTEASGHPIFGEHSYQVYRIDPFQFEVLINGQRRSFRFTASDYQAAGIDLASTDIPLPVHFFRMIALQQPSLLWSSETEILARCGKQNSDLRLFLELSEWQHPDIIEMEMPSDSITFQTLAKAIEARDPSLYVCSAEACNTRWDR